MSMAPTRNPLGLPAGSVRALIALAICASFIIHLFSPHPIPLYLYFLLALVPPFFTAHGTTIRPNPSEPSPLYLPSGVIRLTLSLGTLLAVGYFIYLNKYDLTGLAPDPRTMGAFPNYFIALIAGLFLGFVIGKGPWRNYPYFQDVQAWLSIVALFFLGIELVIELVIRPQSGTLFDVVTWNTILVAILAFYFSSRS